MNVTTAQIEFISKSLTTNGVYSEDLKEDILDHICTAIEADNSQDFETVYKKVISQFGGYTNMQQIQKETTYTIRAKKMLQARKAFYVSSNATAALIIISSLFKIMHWPFASILWLISLSVLLLLCLPLFLYQRHMKSILKIQF